MNLLNSKQVENSHPSHLNKLQFFFEMAMFFTLSTDSGNITRDKLKTIDEHNAALQNNLH